MLNHPLFLKIYYPLAVVIFILNIYFLPLSGGYWFPFPSMVFVHLLWLAIFIISVIRIMRSQKRLYQSFDFYIILFSLLYILMFWGA